MTTLEAAEQVGALSAKQAQQFLIEHGLSFDEASTELGDAVFDAYELAVWVGY